MGCSLPVSSQSSYAIFVSLIISFRQGPISESDFFTWEALICGPKDTPFVSCKPVNSVTARPYSNTLFYRRVAFLQRS